MKVNSFIELVNYIRKEILDDEINQLDIQFWDKEVMFGIYDDFDVKISVMKHKVYPMGGGVPEERIIPELVGELLDGNLTACQVKECYEICELIEENIDLFEDFC